MGKKDETPEEREVRKAAEKKEKKEDKKDKEKDGDKKKDKKDKDETPEERAARKAKKEAKEEAKAKADEKPQPRGPPVGRPAPVLKGAAGKQAKAAAKAGYMDGMDLPSSEESGEETEEIVREDKNFEFGGKTDKEDRKARAKELEAARKEALAKEQAMREDDDAFTVRCANQTDDHREAMANSKDIKIDGFSVSARGKELLVNTDLTVVHGRRYGLVGPNGMGKTTIMKLLARRKLPVPDFIDILLVEQEVVGDERTALESVVAADVELQQLRKKRMELETAMERIAAAEEKGGDNVLEEREAALASALAACKIDEDAESGNGMRGKLAVEAERKAAGELDEDNFDINDEITKVYERLNEKGDATAEARASKILHGLGFTVPRKDGNSGPERFSMHNSTHSFSGGWRMRISLARALFIEPTCLLLDEPTNHLDLRAVIWLEEYLMRWKKTLLVVSHDRDFLNSVSTDIIHLHDQKLSQYRGSFESFEEMYEQRRREANKNFDKYEKQLKMAKAATKGQAKAKQADIKDKFKKDVENKGMKKGNKGMMQDDDEDGRGGEGDAPRKWNDYQVEFHFPTPSELAPPLIGLTDCHFKYPNLEGFALENLNLGIDMGTRVGIIGPNGAGKSTLMNLLAGDLEPTQGDSRRSHKLRIGRYSQHFVDVLAMDENPVQYLLRKYLKVDGGSYKPEEIRAKLGKFGLPGHNHLTPIVKLSGGQKARVVFTAISLSNAHILLMDEPTNHLDMQSIDALAEALDEFEGGVVLITHDAHICGKVLDAETSEIWVVDEGAVTRFDGDFAEYRRQLVAEINDELDDDGTGGVMGA